MPRVKLAAEQYAAADFKRLINFLVSDYTIRELCDLLGVCPKTVNNRKKNPEELSVKELRKIAGVVRMSAEEKDKLRRLIVP